VFEDLDGNGVQNVFLGEMGLAGWTVELHNPDGSVVTTTTDVDGAYMFSQLQDGSYAVCVPSVGVMSRRPQRRMQVIRAAVGAGRSSSKVSLRCGVDRTLVRSCRNKTHS